VVGYGLPKEIAAKALVVFLRAPSLHPRILLRYDLTRKALEEAGVDSATVDAEGKSPLAQMMSAVLFGDWVSLYLAILNGVAPAPTPPIATLKERLAGR
jgi:glucose/mannose-6-phosphate isomerase